MADAKMQARLRKLVAKAIDKEWWAVELCGSRAIERPDDLDAKINVVGALHEAGNLQSVLKPYWVAWRTDPVAWADRCVERLRRGHDGDYWAVAALLGLRHEEIEPALDARGYELITAQRWSDLKGHHRLVHTYGITFGHPDDPSWGPMVQIGCSEADGTVTHLTRARTLTPKYPKSSHWRGEPGRAWGEASTSADLTAKLPSGTWRTPGDWLTIDQDSLLP